MPQSQNNISVTIIADELKNSENIPNIHSYWDLNHPTLHGLRIPSGETFNVVKFPAKGIKEPPLLISDSILEIRKICNDPDVVACSIDTVGIILPSKSTFQRKILPKLLSGELNFVPKDMLSSPISQDDLNNKSYDAQACHEISHAFDWRSELPAFEKQMICLGITPNTDLIMKSLYKSNYPIGSLAMAVADRISEDNDFDPKPFSPLGKELFSAILARKNYLIKESTNSLSMERKNSDDLALLTQYQSQQDINWTSYIGQQFIQGLVFQTWKTFISNCKDPLKDKFEGILTDLLPMILDPSYAADSKENRSFNNEENNLIRDFVRTVKDVFKKCGVPNELFGPLLSEESGY
jgi:hypothetical protein